MTKKEFYETIIKTLEALKGKLYQTEDWVKAIKQLYNINLWVPGRWN